MGIEDKLGNKAQDLIGRGKEAAGAATDNDELKSEGKADQAKAGLKEKVEDAKDKVTEVINKVL